MQLPPWVLVILVCLATHRIAVLITKDYVMGWLRDWAYRRDDRRARGRPDRLPDDEPRGIAYLVGCPWCVSIYAGTLIAFVAVWWPTNRAIVAGLLALSASAVAGELAQHAPPDD